MRGAIRRGLVLFIIIYYRWYNGQYSVIYIISCWVQNTDDVFVYDFIGEKSRRGLLKYLQKLLPPRRDKIDRTAVMLILYTRRLPTVNSEIIDNKI